MNKPPRNVLLVSSGTLHPPLTGRLALHRVLRQMPGFAFRRLDSLEKLLRLDLNNYQAILLYIHHKIISPAALAALDHFVSRGGGLLALHSATASFKTTRHYFEILGGRFTGHDPVQMLHVEPVPGENEPFTGIPAFDVYDEPYIHELQPGIRAHFQVHSAGQLIPLVWTYTYGQGKVCYACPGHTTASLLNPQVQEIVRRGLAWVSS